ncbi:MULTISPECIES: PFGI-1 class ICE element type IV pilus protein PilL2 [Entomomonas]|uniref:Uncharacterized protein n=1 Tax=Entomomonas asaccharolytica TaxID=2785331 RepID=A0A974NHR3_9GAMM|nr:MULTISPECIES: hypothetical protein [Entomomonas]QQP86834.1 hypothetical protein JHT90_06225 [Entomomonas asaccharolytica]UYZ83548.1 hypothetical protein MTZ49_13230 [Entomomonas sp. E2T0]
MKQCIVIISLGLLISLTGCSSKDTTQKSTQQPNIIITDNDQNGGFRNPEPLAPDLYPQGSEPTPEPIIRYGRYNLASAKPTAEQQDLMAQIITTNIPITITNPTVMDAMDYVMQRSGYNLCPSSTSKEIRTLYSRNLPAAHYKLGPITLRNALQVLAGPAFQVNVDEVNRKVCFDVREDYKLPEATSSIKQIAANDAYLATQSTLKNKNNKPVAEQKEGDNNK